MYSFCLLNTILITNLIVNKNNLLIIKFRYCLVLIKAI